ncbi:MAG: aminotransferase class V-fold PLP-dependent enzyme [Bacteroidia bacterium]|nr:aminotransferase class V-fold PLP-dependent enzyme [Bacteroidia bacterium]NNK61483.1 aminotransferase class V-fold PLP-dependent enzyme [Flavobacteriaceae bacterium]RZW46011.1 MAG: aminotransferase class V-fold PLP-dependent enzyme [Flavobacteriaceae bacterium]
MKKRDFIKKMGLATLAAPMVSQAIPNYFLGFENFSANELATNEDFWKNVRSDYKLKPDYINLESGYYNIIPTSTLNAMIAHAKMVNYEGSYYMRTVQWDNKDRMAEKLANLLGSTRKNVIITRNTTESLDMVIKGMSWEAGDEAVYAEQDYGAMKMMFEQVSKRFGTVNKVVSVPNHPKSDEEIVNLYSNAITSKTKLLMVCHMINITGHILPIKKICQMAHSKGVQVMVDGAHCVGHFQFNIPDLECDYYGSSLHKWLAVPLGTGMLYVKDDHIDTLWPIFAEHHREPGDISRLNHTGTLPVYHDLSIENAIDYYNYLGAKRKESRLRYLQNYWSSQVRDIDGIVLNTPKDPARSCGIANVGIEGMKPADLAKRLMEDYKIFTVAIDYANVKGCRITPNVFTLTEELDVFVNALKEMAS